MNRRRMRIYNLPEIQIPNTNTCLQQYSVYNHTYLTIFLHLHILFTTNSLQIPILCQNTFYL